MKQWGRIGDMTEIILGLVILLQFAYIIYKDRAERNERKDLQLKLMSKDVVEYKQATEPAPKDTVEKVDPYVNIEDVDLNKLISADDKI